MDPIDISHYLNTPVDKREKDEKCLEIAKAVADGFCRYGIVIIRDPRVSQELNERFLTLMENYWDLPKEEKMKDTRPDYHFQVGTTPDFTELPRDHRDLIDAYPPSDRPVLPRGADRKWRFFWRIGELPEKTKFPALNAPPVIPERFKATWQDTMNEWGFKLLGTTEIAAELAAIGLGLEKDTFTKMMKMAPHLLAPTGSDLDEYHELQTTFAGFHRDLNFISAHGKSRFPALFIWSREGKKTPVTMPNGCILLQSGIQFEWLTGGRVLAGFHEVVVVNETVKAYEKAKAEGKCTWRVSSTFFAHIASDCVLKPLLDGDKSEVKNKYPEKLTGDQVNEELEHLQLKTK